MLTGAVIGAIVGVVIVFMQLAKHKAGAKKVAKALRRGPADARAALDAYVKPPSGKTSVQRIHELQERFSWLAILGAHDDLEREMAALEGHVTMLGQLRAQGVLGLLAHRTEARDFEALRTTTAFVDAEGGAMLRLVKSILHDQLAVAGVRDGKPLDFEATKRVYDRVSKSAIAAKIVGLRFLARMTGESGANATNLQREADELLAGLTR